MGIQNADVPYQDIDTMTVEDIVTEMLDLHATMSSPAPIETGRAYSLLVHHSAPYRYQRLLAELKKKQPRDYQR